MTLEHIIVDGYNILYQWAALKAARMCSLAAGRQALIHLLTQLHDCRGGKMTLVFDGRSVLRGGDGVQTNIRILYTKEGETADAVIERMVGQSTQPENFLVATDDYAEQSVIQALGGHTISAEAFYAMAKSELVNLEQTLEQISLKNGGSQNYL